MTGWRVSTLKGLSVSLSDIPADVSNEEPAIQRSEGRAFQAEETARTEALRLEVRGKAARSWAFAISHIQNFEKHI